MTRKTDNRPALVFISSKASNSHIPSHPPNTFTQTSSFLSTLPVPRPPVVRRAPPPVAPRAAFGVSASFTNDIIRFALATGVIYGSVRWFYVRAMTHRLRKVAVKLRSAKLEKEERILKMFGSEVPSSPSTASVESDTFQAPPENSNSDSKDKKDGQRKQLD